MIATTAATWSRQTRLSIIGIIAILMAGVLIWAMSAIGDLLPHQASPPIATASPSPTPSSTTSPTPTATPPSTGFGDNFAAHSVLQEADKMADSTSKSWWLNSGALFYARGGYAQTVEGALPIGSKWQLEYAAGNPGDTDSGLHPQNIFRLVTRTKFRELTQQAYFRIDNDNLSASPNRNASNGLFFFNRYQDGDNVYYTGLRVDGFAVIKKKIGGTYYTMDEKRILPGTYDAAKAPNLLPKHTWIGLRSTVQTNANGTVDVQLWSDLGKAGAWQKVAEATDDGKSFGGTPITASGFGGIRTDFMDVSFRQYAITEQPN